MRELVRAVRDAITSDRLALSGTVILMVLVVVALLAPWVAPFDPNQVVYGGEGTLLVHQDGSWRPPQLLSDESLVAVAGSGENVYAAGTTGTVLRVREDEPEILDPPTVQDLAGVAVRDGRVVVVGAGGTILRFVDDEWTVDDVPTDRQLTDVALGERTGLAVGEGGSVLVWDGETWSGLDPGVETDLFAVALLRDDFGFVVGAEGTLLHFDGEDLTPVEGAGFRDLFDVDISAPDEALVVGERGVILRFDGQRWERMLSPESRDLNGVWLGEDGSAWAAGDRGVVLHLSGDIWSLEDVDYSQNLLAVDEAEGRLLAVGSDPVVKSLAAPSRHHLFGTTELGHDVFSQTVWGSRTALLVGFLAAALVVLIGTNVGLVAGYFRGRTDDALMRLVDLMYGLPFEPFALILVVVFRPSLLIVVLAIGLLVWRTNARVIRSQVLSLSNRPFVKAARIAGASDWRILYVHIAPNVLPLVFLQLAIAVAFAISAEATLSFLGLGPPDSFSWGTILFDARLSGAWRTAWWWTIPPGALITVAILSVFFVSRALEVLSNPRLKRAIDAA